VRAIGMQGVTVDSSLPSSNGSLDELRASNILAGPFRIRITSTPSEHLTFDDSHGRPVIRLLSGDRILMIYVAQRTGFVT
jgi:hypothetical protein